MPEPAEIQDRAKEIEEAFKNFIADMKAIRAENQELVGQVITRIDKKELEGVYEYLRSLHNPAP